MRKQYYVDNKGGFWMESNIMTGCNHSLSKENKGTGLYFANIC